MDAGVGPAGGDRRDGELALAAGGSKAARLSRWGAVLGPVLGLGAITLLFAVLIGSPERYLSAANLRVVLAQTVIVAIGAIGMTLIMISAGIDLSVGASIALTSVVTALALRSDWAPAAAILLGILIASRMWRDQ